MDNEVFYNMCTYLSNKSKHEKPLTQQQKDMIEEDKRERERWAKQK